MELFTIRKVLSIALIVSLGLFALPPQPVHAASIVVDTLAETYNTGDGNCTIREAIAAAMYDAAVDQCAAGSGDDTISFSVAGTITLTSRVFVDHPGNGAVIVDGGDNITIEGLTYPTMQFDVSSGMDFALHNMILTNTDYAIHAINSTVLLDGVTIIANSSFGIYAENASTVVVNGSTFDGNRYGIYIYDAASDTTVTNSTFQNGTNDSIMNLHGTLSITNSNFLNNTGGHAVYSGSGSNLSVTGSTFVGNTGTNSGLAISNSGIATISTSTFTNNQAVDVSNTIGGGTVTNNNGTMTISDSTFNGNLAEGSAALGGAIYNSTGTLTVRDSLLINNAATSASSSSNGGAIYSGSTDTGSLIVDNVTFSNNSAKSGAVIYINRGDLALSNSTFTGNNIVDEFSFAHYLYGAFEQPATLYNNLFLEDISSGTTIRHICGITTSASINNIANENTCGSPATSAADIALGALGNYGGSTMTFPLLPGSAAINAGDNAHCSAADQRSITRPQQSTCDVGAFESQGFNIAITGGNNQTTAINTAFANPLALSVSSAFGEPVDGGRVSFTAPSSGASSSFAPSTIATIASGAAALPVTANATEGSYTVSATTNGAGSTLSYSLTNSAPPTVSSISRADSNPTNAVNIIYTVIFSKAVTGVDSTDFSLNTNGLTGSSINSVSGSGTTWTVSVITGTGDGSLQLNLNDNDSIIDGDGFALVGSGTGNGDFSGETYTIDRTAPSVTSILRDSSDPVAANASADFEITFDEAVTNVDSADFAFTYTGASTGASVTSISGSGDTWGVTINTGSGAGTVQLDVAASATITDLAGNALAGPVSGDEAFTIDTTNPTISSITRHDPNPTTASVVTYDVGFDKFLNETTITAANFDLTTTGFQSGASISNISCGSGATGTECQVAITTGAGNGTIRLDVPDTSTITDLVGNTLGNIPYTSGEEYVIDLDAADIISILRQNPLASPTNATPVTFRVTFGENMQNVDITDFALAFDGTATGTLDSVSIISADVYDVSVRDVSGTGQIELSIDSGHDIEDLVGNTLPAAPNIGSLERYQIDNAAITIMGNGIVGTPGAVSLLNNQSYTSHFTSLTVTFSKDANNPAGDVDADDVTNPNNYLLFQAGVNGVYDTPTCAAYNGNGNMPLLDDVQIPTGPITYENNSGAGPFEATVTLNNGTALPRGAYRLLVCGTTSIYDLAGNELNGGIDSQTNFQIIAPAALPATGFAPGKTTVLAEAIVQYVSMDDLVLEIPGLGVKESIIGVPASEDNWNITWLKNQIGWLAGTAYPTWEGNTVLTGHLYDANGEEGPFVDLAQMQWGQQILIHAYGKVYTYEVRTIRNWVKPTDTSWITKHEDYDWITLVTCRGYNEQLEAYQYRTIVRAVLVGVAEK